MQKVEELLCKMVWGQLQSLGLFTEKNVTTDRRENAKLLDLYDRWFEETIAVLVRNHYLEQEGDSYTVVDPTSLDLDALWKEWDLNKLSWMADRNMKAMVVLVDATLKALPDILTGKASATDIMFPNSSMELVEGVYKQNQVADYFNEVLADTLVAYIQERVKQDPAASIRMIEIGAGTGGTSATVFKKLKPYQSYIQEYGYTDLSKAFLMHAEKEYGLENPYVTYQIFNVEEPIVGQGIEAGGYDVVIAANVLHATKNIRETLRNAKATLKNNGLILLNEINSNNLFSHLTFGLLEGWWLYEDPELRIPGCPGLDSVTWQRVLESEGFRHVSFMAPEAHELGQQIIVAESDGVVRQRQSLEPRMTSIKQNINHKKLHITQGERIKDDSLQVKKENPGTISDDFLSTQTLTFVKETLAKAIKLTPDKIELEVSFEKYGIDSILQINFIRELEQVTGELPKTILFEYNNTQELVEYLVKNHSDQLKAWISPESNEESKQETPIDLDSTEHVVTLIPQTDRFRKPQVVHHQEEFSKEPKKEDIAIIGISGRYPLSNTLEELWEHLKAGHNCITEASDDRWQTSLVKLLSKDPSQKSEKKYYGGFLEQIDRFDYQLFETSHQQVMEMTPELRLFLEVVWETFENAGYAKYELNELQEREQNGIGVFVGNMYNQYFWSIPSLEQAALSSNGTDWHIANRVSHFFNLTGPSLAVNTACSSSLSAIHLACESLKQKGCSMAIAGGINLTLDRSKYDLLDRANLLGAGNKSKSFGVGDGLIPGEGVGAVLLKPLSKAIQDCDPIYGVIKSSSANHSGGRQMYTAPDPKQQAKLITRSIQQSGIDPTTIGYMESAANGSALGDPIEVIALQHAFANYTEEKQFCAMGSVKSNIGHLEAASGISQLSKVLLQMKHQTLVPTINVKPLNPNIKLEKTAFYLQEKTEPWKPIKDRHTGENLPRRSMINSFGAGGAYANLIVEEYHRDTPTSVPDLASREEFLIIFSAQTTWSLLQYLEKMRVFLKNDASIQIGDVARSLQKLNHGLENRVAIIASSIHELIEKLAIFQKSKSSAEYLGIYTTLDRQSNFASPDAQAIQQLLEEKDLQSLANRWVAGERIDFRPLYKDLKDSQIVLPTYAFDHHVSFSFNQRDFAVNEESDRFDENYQRSNLEDEKGLILETYVYDEPYLKGHKMNDEQVLIGATYGSLAINAFFKLFPEEDQVQIRKLNYVQPVEVKKNQKVEVQVKPLQKESEIDFQVMYRYTSSDAWKVTATGQFKKAPFESKKIDIASIKAPLVECHQDIDRIYAQGMGIVEWGDVFKTITHLYTGNDQILARMDLSENSPEENHDYDLNPLITNSAYLAMLHLLEQFKIAGGLLPFGINKIKFKKNGKFENCWLHIKLVKKSSEIFIFDVDVINDESELVVHYSGYSLKRSHFSEGNPQHESLKNLVSSHLNVRSKTDDIADQIQKYVMDKLNKMTASQLRESNIDTIHVMELGLSSLELVALTKEIERDAEIELNPTLFFEYPNLKELTEFFAKEHQSSFIQLLGKRSEQAKVSTYISEESEIISPIVNEEVKPNERSDESIAVIGMSGQFPGSENLEELWGNLVNGKNCITEIPKDRWDWREYCGDSTEASKTSLQWGGFIDGVGDFDPLFFGISPREATLMDPQQHLLLTHTWKAMEDAGVTGQALSQSSTGVFVAAGNNEYVSTSADPFDSLQTPMIPSLIPNRISYALNLRGPSEYCEATCSSTFVALHRAIQSIRNHECEQAIVGAVNLLLSPKGFLGFDSMGYLSREGQAKSFQTGANGFVRSEGVGVIIIKPLQKAIVDSDPIYAVIRGTGVRHGGKGLSLNAPNPNGIKEAMVKAYQGANIDPKTVSYIEAHGIASPLADAIEIDALKSGYQQLSRGHSQTSQEETPCYISSLKPCIGHGELVSGMAALFKVILAMKNKLIPGIPGFTSLNDQISLKGSPFQLTSENHKWEELKDDQGRPIPRRASINNYGFGGVNAHVVLEEYLPAKVNQIPDDFVDSPQILVFSAKNQDRLYAVAHQMLEYVKRSNDLSIPHFAYTLQVGREAMDCRLAMVVVNREELIQGLEEYLEVTKESKGLKSSIPVFIGNREEDSSVRSLLDGKLGEVVLQTLLSEKNFEKLALYWTKGGDFSWESLHEGQGLYRISLPTYPFEKRRCWKQSEPATKRIVEQPRSKDQMISISKARSISVDDRIIDIISDLLGMTATEMNPHIPLKQYGFDSILFMQLFQRLKEEIDPSVSIVSLQACETMQDVINALQLSSEEKSIRSEQKNNKPILEAQPHFPELIHLNGKNEGRPVFWFHGGVGGVEIYQKVAQKSLRPFYGIQARGFMTDHPPLNGIQQMASYYIDIIQSVQLEGPYDLGGYSLGGMLAYEITRQLQELGEVVNTIVMIDSPGNTNFQGEKPSLKTSMLQTMNTMLSTLVQKPEELAQTLISREEVDLRIDEEEFLKQLIILARARGLTKTETQIQTHLQQNVKIQSAYELQDYMILPLPDPQGLDCYYFRNKSGQFLGELEPYFTTVNEPVSLDHTTYWEEWERQIPKFHMMDVDSSNHMTMLAEPQSSETICEFCGQLYF
ncbi:beta-ketoacyl synthase N-terminal-like domain-containing protein [Hazenella coriacea]|uniref:Polyketide synthase PksR n=1 Tax=Hazenella coriacea TaxID=1179467 RepID=A0A4R3L631_9BACL|nr:beta-ketoacyl synthase N-terminal-like domain-containing protein [Hazenella coriacea]TCS93644.1 polyketide synthase PksR [Hazenella coriacea]